MPKVKRKRSAETWNPYLNSFVKQYKGSNDILLFLAGSILAGFAFGVGGFLSNIVTKAYLKEADRETGLLPPPIRKELFKDDDDNSLANNN